MIIITIHRVHSQNIMNQLHTFDFLKTHKQEPNCLQTNPMMIQYHPSTPKPLRQSDRERTQNFSCTSKYNFFYYFWHWPHADKGQYRYWIVLLAVCLLSGACNQSGGLGLKTPQSGVPWAIVFKYFRQFREKRWLSTFRHFCSEALQ